MPMTDKEKVLEKLKKLLALSKSDNPHEASLALQRVQKLMQAYGISWTVMLLCWPVALPLYVDYVRGKSKGEVDDD